MVLWNKKYHFEQALPALRLFPNVGLLKIKEDLFCQEQR